MLALAGAGLLLFPATAVADKLDERVTTGHVEFVFLRFAAPEDRTDSVFQGLASLRVDAGLLGTLVSQPVPEGRGRVLAVAAGSPSPLASELEPTGRVGFWGAPDGTSWTSRELTYLGPGGVSLYAYEARVSSLRFDPATGESYNYVVLVDMARLSSAGEGEVDLYVDAEGGLLDLPSAGSAARTAGASLASVAAWAARLIHSSLPEAWPFDGH